MPKKVWFYMRAYNTERYIRQALDSLINQSDPDWALWIEDNGSTDQTGKICDEYAAKDERILCFHYKVNNRHTCEECEEAQFLFKQYNILSVNFAEYVATLDSDDYYHSDFVKVMYSAAKKNSADMVVCGTTMFMDDSPNVGRVRVPPDIVIRNQELQEQDFIRLYGSLRPYWGKLYSMEIWKQKDQLIPHTGEVYNGFDTYQNLKLLSHFVQTVACVAQPLHYYRIRESSDYYKILDSKRFHEGTVLFNVGVEAAKRYNIYTPTIQSFLYTVYMNHVKDLMNLAANSKILSPAEKIEFISCLLSEQLFIEYAKGFPTETMQLLKFMVQTVLESLGVLERAKLKRFFLVRFFDRPSELSNKKDYMIWLFSILCDPENRYHWGSNHFSDINATKTESVIEAINDSCSAKYDLAKDEFLEALNRNNVNLALEKLEFLTSSIPLDKEVLSFEMYISLTLGDFAHALETAEIARVFWREDKDINQMIQNVYSTVDNREV